MSKRGSSFKRAKNAKISQGKTWTKGGVIQNLENSVAEETQGRGRENAGNWEYKLRILNDAEPGVTIWHMRTKNIAKF